MKKSVIIAALLLLLIGESFAQRNPYTRRLGENKSKRKEFILPQVNGYNIYKADLHTHTAFSDGSLMPKARVEEAFRDGMDIIAITDHIEYRTNEQKFLDFTGGYHKGTPKAKNNLIHREAADKDGIRVDLNFSITDAYKYGKRYGVMIIPGAEISRHPDQYGHFNALFIKDANTIYDPVPEESLRKAKAQGALVMHNHPGWRRSTIERNEWHTKIYQEGLIDGIEIINGMGSWPRLLATCKEEKLFVGAGTDIHGVSPYNINGYHRTCTFIFAKACNEAEIKKAIKEGRTLAYGANNVMGDKQLLSDLFNASIVATVLRQDEDGKRVVLLTNNSSIPYHIRRGSKGVGLYIEPFSSGTVELKPGQKPEYFVTNMWYGDQEKPNSANPKVLIELD